MLQKLGKENFFFVHQELFDLIMCGIVVKCRQEAQRSGCVHSSEETSLKMGLLFSSMWNKLFGSKVRSALCSCRVWLVVVGGFDLYDVNLVRSN